MFILDVLQVQIFLQQNLNLNFQLLSQARLRLTVYLT